MLIFLDIYTITFQNFAMINNEIIQEFNVKSYSISRKNWSCLQKHLLWVGQIKKRKNFGQSKNFARLFLGVVWHLRSLWQALVKFDN